MVAIYNVPEPGYSPRVMDIDSQDVVWTSLAIGHLGGFDGRKCKVVDDPTATENHCPEGKTLNRIPDRNSWF